MPLFQRRHYDQLAWWAGIHRALAELGNAAGYNTRPQPIEANLDDVISNSDMSLLREGN